MNNSTTTQDALSEIQSHMQPFSLYYQSEAAALVEFPTPFTASVISRLFSFEGSQGIAYKSLGLPITKYKTDDYVKYLFSRVFLDIGYENIFFYKNLGLQYMPESSGSNPELKPLQNIVSRLIGALRNAFVHASILQQKQQIINKAQSLFERLYPQQPSQQNDSDSVAQLEALVKEFTEDYAVIFELSYLEGLIAQTLPQEEIAKLSPASNDLYVESTDILGSKDITVTEIIARFGTRGFNDFEFAAPRWHEIPDVLQKLRSPQTHQAPILAAVPPNQRTIELQEIITLKDNLRLAITAYVDSIRKALFSIAKAHEITNDLVFYLTLDDFERLKPNEWLNVARRRKTEYENGKEVYLPRFITINTVKREGAAQIKKQYKAIPVSSGSVTAPIFKVSNSEKEIPQGIILLLPHAGPEFTVFYKNAVGIIFQKGGILSHGAIIAREMRIPAVVCADFDSSAQLAILDASKGEISLTEESAT
ncbi:MAG: PEP-utilizing enzyme [Patescibacteria group bacterium]